MRVRNVWMTQWIFYVWKLCSAKGPGVRVGDILLINTSCDPAMSKNGFYCKIWPKLKTCFFFLTILIFILFHTEYYAPSFSFLFCFVFSVSQTLRCSADLLSRRWGSLWSACCGSSTASFIKGGGNSGLISHKRTHVLALASQGGVGNSSRPQGHIAVTKLTSTLTGLSKNTERSCKVKGEMCSASCCGLSSSPLSSSVVPLNNRRARGSVRSPSQLQLHLFSTRCLCWRRLLWYFRRYTVVVDFHTGEYSTQLKPLAAIHSNLKKQKTKNISL